MTIFYWITGFILFALAMSLLNKRQLLAKNAERKLQQQQVEHVIKTDFKVVDEIAQGKRWVGAEAEIVCARNLYRYDFEFKQVLLCRTKKKAWFVVEYVMNGINIERRSVHQSDEETARSWLEYDRAAYIKYFELPEMA